MKINTKTFNMGKGLYVKAWGKIDLETAVEYGTTVKDLLDDIEELTLDFEDINYISSIGLRVILELHQQMETQGKMKLTNVQAPVLNIFKMTGFDKFLTIA
ncbi:STAS domain-containing protein [bacterium]|nr:STAS domain-containing protein [bacterium]